jgi:Uma2 family endonuclease
MAESPTSAPAGAVGERTTYEEFLRCFEGESAEWVDGWVYPMSPVGGAHQDVGLFLASVLSMYVQRRDLGTVRYEKFQMRLETTGREPDVLFVAAEHRERLHETYLEGGADLAVEIVSPESRRRDRGEKFFEYERGGVREFWLIDPERRAVEFYVLIDGRFEPRLPDADGMYHSTVVDGFWLRVEWLWTTPDVLDVAAELGLR